MPMYNPQESRKRENLIKTKSKLLYLQLYRYMLSNIAMLVKFLEQHLEVTVDLYVDKY
jgi:hypothetical protein